MAEVVLKNIKKVYPNTEKSEKKRKGMMRKSKISRLQKKEYLLSRILILKLQIKSLSYW